MWVVLLCALSALLPPCPSFTIMLMRKSNHFSDVIVSGSEIFSVQSTSKHARFLFPLHVCLMHLLHGWF